MHLACHISERASTLKVTFTAYPAQGMKGSGVMCDEVQRFIRMAGDSSFGVSDKSHPSSQAIYKASFYFKAMESIGDGSTAAGGKDEHGDADRTTAMGQAKVTNQEGGEMKHELQKELQQVKHQLQRQANMIEAMMAMFMQEQASLYDPYPTTPPSTLNPLAPEFSPSKSVQLLAELNLHLAVEDGEEKIPNRPTRPAPKLSENEQSSDEGMGEGSDGMDPKGSIDMDGCSVSIIGLVKAVDLNDLRGVAMEFEEATGRFQVMLASGPRTGEIVRIKRENLRLLSKEEMEADLSDLMEEDADSSS